MNSMRFSMLLAIGVAFGGYNYVSADVAAVAGAAHNFAKEAGDTGAEALDKFGASLGIDIDTSCKLKNKLRELKEVIGSDLGKLLISLGFGVGFAVSTLCWRLHKCT
ncbi:MAG: hypothetical protein WD055_01760 [Candidatus Dependentiae bacterium]